MQDWVGTFKFPEGVRLLWNWQLNNQHYPDWDGMLEEWAKDGVHPMVYMNPYFANLTGNPEIRTNYFKYLDDHGYFIKNTQNESYEIKSVSIEFGMVDFSNPDAYQWCKETIINNMIKEAKSVGWMHDFGEYTPTMGVKFNGYQGYTGTYHNRYPYEWAKISQEAIREAGTEDETVYFMRAGSTMSPGKTSLFWMGD